MIEYSYDDALETSTSTMSPEELLMHEQEYDEDAEYFWHFEKTGETSVDADASPFAALNNLTNQNV